MAFSGRIGVRLLPTYTLEADVCDAPLKLEVCQQTVAALRADNAALAACLRELLEDGFAKDGWEDDYEAARDKADKLLRKRGDK